MVLDVSAFSPQTLDFPPDFVWGSATSSFQIEGATDVDGRLPSIWDTFCAEPGRIVDGSNGDQACDHYNRFAGDVALMKELSLQAYRFSIAWGRVMKLDGDGRLDSINPAGLDFYDRLVDELLRVGIRPLPTLYHWDLPQVLQDQGGWLSRDTASAFAEYTTAVVDRIGDRVDTFTTLNEPFVSADHGHVTGEHAPGGTSMADGFSASHHLLLAHGLAGERIRSAAPQSRLAIVVNFTPLTPHTASEADRSACYHRENIENRWYSDPVAGLGYPQDTADFFGWDQAEVRDGDMEKIATPIDLLGINFYTREIVSADDSYEVPEGTRRNSMGWEIHPPSFGGLLRWVHDRYHFPSILITENGAPMPDTIRRDGRVIDLDRIAYIRDHLAEVHGAIQDGCPIEGYLVWSLLDNFEWRWGYGPRFGIVEVDFETLERTPKESALWYRNVIEGNEVALDEIRR